MSKAIFKFLAHEYSVKIDLAAMIIKEPTGAKYLAPNMANPRGGYVLMF